MSQIKDSACSVPANIAEGWGRYHYKDKQKFMYNARGSLYETLSHALLAQKLFGIPDKDINELKADIDLLGIKLNNLIKAIGRSSSY